MISVDICICTFRRPHIADTIRSVAKLSQFSNRTIRIIVADNDDVPSARELVEAIGREIDSKILYMHAPSCNISIARNACLEAATSPLIAFIDDDECVTTGWLENMLITMKKFDADVVLGPVRASYSDSCPEWLKQGDFLSTRPVFVNGRIITGYSGNVLLRRLSPALKNRRFRLEFGSGGEDTAFFSAVYQSGGRIVYAPYAVVTEEVPIERTTLRWLLKRYFQAGQTHGRLLREKLQPGIKMQYVHACKALAKAGFCAGMAVLCISHFRHMAYWTIRGTLHTGVVFSILRQPELQIA